MCLAMAPLLGLIVNLDLIILPKMDVLTVSKIATNKLA